MKYRKDEEMMDVDENLPMSEVNLIKLEMIILVAKPFRDVPKVFSRENTINETYIQNSELANQPLNEMQASKYEEFILIKINDKGKRQDRMLGIDQSKIYNINLKSRNQTLNMIDKML